MVFKSMSSICIKGTGDRPFITGLALYSLQTRKPILTGGCHIAIDRFMTNEYLAYFL